MVHHFFNVFVKKNMSMYTYLRIRLNTLLYADDVFIQKYAHTCNLGPGIQIALFNSFLYQTTKLSGL